MIYEVNLRIDAQVAGDFLPWLRAHIQEMLQIPGFQSGALFSRRPEDEGESPEGVVLLTVHYTLDGPDAVEAYLEGPAPRMRQEGLDRFGDHFSATRRFLSPL